MRHVLLAAAAAAADALWHAAAAAAATYHRCCAVLPLLLHSSPHGVGQPAISFVAETRGCGYILIHFFNLTITFLLLDKPWSQVSSLLPPGKFVNSSSNFSNSRSHDSRSSSFYARKSPYKHEHALSGTRTHNLNLVGTIFIYYNHYLHQGRHYNFCPRAPPCSLASTAGPRVTSGVRDVLLPLLYCCSTAAAATAALLLLLRAAPFTSGRPEMYSYAFPPCARGSFGRA